MLSTTLSLEAHRGGRGERTENTLGALAHTLELGCTAMEVDTQMTRDGVVVVWHDGVLSPLKCRDTAPVVAGDPRYPYVGKRVRDLTYAQVSTVSCAVGPLEGFEAQQVVPDARIARLTDYFALAERRGAHEFRWDIELKFGPDDVDGHRREHVIQALEDIRRWGLIERVQVQSFDWTALDQARYWEPTLRLSGLVESLTRSPGALSMDTPDAATLARLHSPEDAQLGVDPRDAAAHGFQAWGPHFSMLTPAAIATAHDLGLKVIPWTVNEVADMRRLVEWGVDGLISDYPSAMMAAFSPAATPR